MALKMVRLMVFKFRSVEKSALAIVQGYRSNINPNPVVPVEKVLPKLHLALIVNKMTSKMIKICTLEWGRFIDNKHIYANIYLYYFRGEIKMGQVTIYIDDKTEQKMLNMVEKSGMSKSKWIAELIREKTATTWPQSVVQLAGAWTDLPSAEEIRAKMGKDTLREKI